MISTENVAYPVIHDFGRPHLTNDSQWDFWQRFFTLVESSPILMHTNGVYDAMRRYAFDKQGYAGGGFKFCFAFKTEADRKAFCDEVDKL